MEVFHCLIIVPSFQRNPHATNIIDNKTMETLHRFTHRRLYQRHVHTNLRNDVNTMEIFHR